MEMLQAQTREKQQPFFKPLTHTDNVNGLFESQNQNRQKSFVQQKYTSRSREIENAQETVASTEKLSSLHSKIHQQLDKQRKWEVQTEIEIKQKDKFLNEATVTIDQQRKSILDLQFQNENLSLRLQEEIENREEIIQRINSTRELCGVLKEYCSKTQERLLICETERTELKYKEREHSQLFEELSLKFRNLQIKAEDDHTHLTSELAAECEKKENLQKAFTEKLADAQLQLRELVNKCDEKDIEIRDIRSQLCKNEDKIYDLNNTCSTLQQTLNNCEHADREKQSKIDRQEQELNKTRDNLQYIKKVTCDIHNKMETWLQPETSEDINMDESAYDVSCLVQKVDHLLNLLRAEQQRVKDQESHAERLENYIEELKSSKDILIMEKSEMETRLQTMTKKKIDLMNDKSSLESSSLELDKTIAGLSMELANQRDDSMNKEITIESLKTEIESLIADRTALQETVNQTGEDLTSKVKQLEKLTIQLQEVTQEKDTTNLALKNVTEELKVEKCKHEETTQALTLLQSRLVETETELANIVADTKSLQSEIQTLSKNEQILQDTLAKFHQSELSFKDEISNLKEELKNEKEQNEELKGEQMEQRKIMDTELKEKSVAATTMEDKMKTMKDNITAKNKQIKDLEKEIRSLKSKLTSQKKLLEDKEKQSNEVMSDVEQAEKTNSTLQDRLDELQKIADKSNLIAEQERKKSEKARQLSNKAELEKKEVVQQCDVKIAEMMATLNQYQQDFNKMVAQKDKELETLRQVVETSDSRDVQAKLEMEKVVKDLQDEMESHKEKLQALENEKIVVETKCSNSEKQITKLEKSLTAKEKEITTLKGKVKQSKKKEKMETKGIQTDPLPASKPAYIPSTPNIHACGTPKKVLGLSAKDESKIPNVPATPRTPCYSKQSFGSKTECKTPKQQTKSPKTLLTLRTPQRSILKQTIGDSAIKKRKVAFASDGEDNDSSDTDSSQLMEIEINEDVTRKGSTVPLHIRPSPKVTSQMKENIDHQSPKMVPINRVPRGPPVRNTKSKVEGKAKSADHSKTIIKEKFSLDEDTELNDECCKNPNVRKTPLRTPGKFFTTSPKERPSKKTKAKENSSWFDLDSVFGFED